MRKKREKRILRGTVFCGVLVALFVFCALPALAGENGTLLWWGRGDFAWKYVEEVRQDAEEAKVDLITNEDGESLANFLKEQNIGSLDSPVVLYWVPDHGTGWSNVGGYTLMEVAAMVEEAKGALNGQKLDVTILGPCYAGNIEAMSCFAGLTEKVFATSTQSYVGLCSFWLDWLENTGDTSFENYVKVQYRDSWDPDMPSTLRRQLADPQKLLDFIKAIRGKSLHPSAFQGLLHDEKAPVEMNDVWDLAENCEITSLLEESNFQMITPDKDYWEGLCFLSCWNGENEEQYIATVPEANRCIPGSSVTPDEPTPVPEGAASGGGGCMVGANNFPALLLLIPLTVVMVKRGKK